MFPGRDSVSPGSGLNEGVDDQWLPELIAASVSQPERTLGARRCVRRALAGTVESATATVSTVSIVDGLFLFAIEKPVRVTEVFRGAQHQSSEYPSRERIPSSSSSE